MDKGLANEFRSLYTYPQDLSCNTNLSFLYSYYHFRQRQLLLVLYTTWKRSTNGTLCASLPSSQPPLFMYSGRLLSSLWSKQSSQSWDTYTPVIHTLAHWLVENVAAFLFTAYLQLFPPLLGMDYCLSTSNVGSVNQFCGLNYSQASVGRFIPITRPEFVIISLCVFKKHMRLREIPNTFIKACNMQHNW
jgi:hypothetical protein